MKRLTMFGIMILFLVGLVQAVSLDSIGDKTVDENATLTFTVAASNLNGTAVFSTDSTVGTFDVNTGVFTYTPDFTVAPRDGTTQYTILFGVTDNGDATTDSETITLTVNDVSTTKLRVTDLDVNVGGEKDTNICDDDDCAEDGYDINEDAFPGDRVTFSLEVSNLFTDDEDIEIENVFVTITISDIDDGDDLEEETDEQDIKADKNEDFKLEFEVPELVDLGEYDVLIEIEGEDEEGDDHTIVLEYILNVDKENHKLLIKEADLSPETVSCGQRTNLDLRILNLGDDEEDEVKVTVQNSELSLDFEEEDIELEEGVDDAEYDTSIGIGTDNIEPGNYPIEIRVYRDDTKLEESQTVTLSVGECEKTTPKPTPKPQPEEEEEEDVVVVVPPKTDDTQEEGSFPVIAQPVSEPFTESTGYVVVLTLGVLILLVLLVLIVMLLVRK